MLFNSLTFVVFFVPVYLLYLVLGNRNQNRFLLLASLFFYGMWSWKFLGLLALSISIDFTSGILIEDAQSPVRRKRLLLLSMVMNLGLLGFFKYYNFFIDSLDLLLQPLGTSAQGLHLDLVLPVGISFYTFHSMSYVIDIYQRKLKACRSFVDFALFVTFFPQLVAGPIARAHSLLPQIVGPRSITPAQIEGGISLIVWGLCKKVVVGDGCAIIVNEVFGHSERYAGVDMLLAVYAFAFQIYGDFSGYSDMARGLAKLMGVELSLNFNLPYLALNPPDFWKRWHISLSSWLRDYLYILLGGNRGGAWKTYRNLFLTMLLGGIWHGASWTMVFWGMFHGVILIVHRLWSGPTEAPAPKGLRFWLQCLFMFHVTCLGWLLFRANTLPQVWLFLTNIVGNFSATGVSLDFSILLLQLAVPLLVIEAFLSRGEGEERFVGWPAGRRVAFFMSLFWLSILFLVLHRSQVQRDIPFIYFQF